MDSSAHSAHSTSVLPRPPTHAKILDHYTFLFFFIKKKRWDIIEEEERSRKLWHSSHESFSWLQTTGMKWKVKILHRKGWASGALWRFIWSPAAQEMAIWRGIFLIYVFLAAAAVILRANQVSCRWCCGSFTSSEEEKYLSTVCCFF